MTIDPKTLRFAHEPLAFGPRHTIAKGVIRPRRDELSPAQRRIERAAYVRDRKLATRCTACRVAKVGLAVAVVAIAGLVSLGLYFGVI